MAVALEIIELIVPLAVIMTKYPGGWGISTCKLVDPAFDLQLKYQY